MKLDLLMIHPFIRRTGIAFDMVQERFLKSYDHRLLIPLKSGGSLEVKDHYHILSVNQVYIVPPDTEYRVKLEPGQKLLVVNFDWTMNHVSHYDMALSCFAEEFDKQWITEKVDWSELFGDREYLVWKLPPGNLERAYTLVEKYLAVKPDRAARTMLLSAVFTEMIFHFLNDEPVNEPKAEKIYQYICTHYAEELTLRTLSEEFNYHPTYINRLLTEQYGKSFKQLLIRARMKQALLLLDDPSLSVSIISDKLGFFDYQHFQRSFTKYYGVSPAKYRSR